MRFLSPRALCLSLALGAAGACGEQSDPDAFGPGSPDAMLPGSLDGGPMGSLDGSIGLDADMALTDTGIDPGSLTADEALDRYYPYPAGSRWVYRHLGGTAPWDETVTMEATEFEGQPAILMKDTPGPSGTRSESVLTRQEGGVFRVNKLTFLGATPEERAVYTPGFVRFHGRWVVEGTGHTETLGYARMEYHGVGGQLLRDGTREHAYTVVATHQQVVVPAGTFEDCVHIRRMRVRDAEDPTAEEDDKDYWFCPGVGKVLELTPTERTREELLECDIPGGACP